VFLVINDQGLFRSRDKGATWARCDGGAVTGRCETGYVLDADPAGNRLAVFVVYGSSAITFGGGQTWKVAAPLPPDTTADRMTTFAWDVAANVFYVSRMTKPAYKFRR
jgi:hypothetical protein